MMGLLRAVAKSNRSIQTGIQDQGLMLSLSRQLSTQMETPQKDKDKDNSSDPFLQNPSTGLIYKRLLINGKHTRKSDVINMLGTSRLSLDDVRFEYNANYAPVAAIIQFTSWNVYDSVKAGNRKGGLIRMERADRQMWDALPRYDGKTILLQGIPRNAVAEDVERFLAGCRYDASSIQMFGRQPTRTVLVEFPSQTLATHAFITKNRGFCLNNQVTLRLLQ